MCSVIFLVGIMVGRLSLSVLACHGENVFV